LVTIDASISACRYPGLRATPGPNAESSLFADAVVQSERIASYLKSGISE